MLRAVIDTNIVFTGLTSRGPCGDVMDAWVGRRFLPCVSTALALEYEATLTNKLGDRKRPHALGALQALLDRAEFIPISTRIRPLSPDADDDRIIECAWSAGAPLVTLNRRDLAIAEQVLGIPVISPTEFLKRMEEVAP
jgi:predicted nucleic acid-binding protein